MSDSFNCTRKPQEIFKKEKEERIIQRLRGMDRGI